MGSQRITIRVSETLGSRLRIRSRAKGQSPSELVRVALENYLGTTSGAHSAYELAQQAGLIGIVRGAPRNLSTHRRHFEGFGKSR
jgi:metal-responsive CopG/Arc/MetJ family transcriptional regulator